MHEVKFSYDSEQDDLFVYSGEKSKGSVELGNFVFDFDKDGRLVAFQILHATETLSQLAEKTISSLKDIKECKIDIVNMRNVYMVKIFLVYGDGQITTSLLAPRVSERSPVLQY